MTNIHQIKEASKTAKMFYEMRDGFPYYIDLGMREERYCELKKNGDHYLVTSIEWGDADYFDNIDYNYPLMHALIAYKNGEPVAEKFFLYKDKTQSAIKGIDFELINADPDYSCNEQWIESLFSENNDDVSEEEEARIILDALLNSKL